MYSEQDVDVKLSRDQEKCKKTLEKKETKLPYTDVTHEEFDIKNKEIDGIICEFEKTAERERELWKRKNHKYMILFKSVNAYRL